MSLELSTWTLHHPFVNIMLAVRFVRQAVPLDSGAYPILGVSIPSWFDLFAGTFQESRASSKVALLSTHCVMAQMDHDRKSDRGHGREQP
jgi:hypothetical protein